MFHDTWSGYRYVVVPRHMVQRLSTTLAVACILAGERSAPGPLTIGMQLKQLGSKSYRLLLHEGLSNTTLHSLKKVGWNLRPVLT